MRIRQFHRISCEDNDSPGILLWRWEGPESDPWGGWDRGSRIHITSERGDVGGLFKGVESSIKTISTCFQKYGVSPQNGWKPQWKTLLKNGCFGGKTPYFWRATHLNLSFNLSISRPSSDPFQFFVSYDLEHHLRDPQMPRTTPRPPPLLGDLELGFFQDQILTKV